MPSLAAEIAYVADQREAALTVLERHMERQDGPCPFCGERPRRDPCPPARQAQVVMDWAARRMREINRMLDARVDAHRTRASHELVAACTSGGTPR